jgi:hypothetical protein
MSDKVTFYAVRNRDREVVVFPEQPSYNEEMKDYVSAHGSFKLPKGNRFHEVHKKINQRLTDVGPVVQIELFMAVVR